jgi:hypothetical protein
VFLDLRIKNKEIIMSKNADTVVSITRANRASAVNFRSNCNFFKCGDYYTFERTQESVTVKKCYFEIPKTARKCLKEKHHAFSFFLNFDMPLGLHEIDLEESNEDSITVYFNNLRIN